MVCCTVLCLASVLARLTLFNSSFSASQSLLSRTYYRLNVQHLHVYCTYKTPIKKKRKFSSNTMKFRWDRVQTHTVYEEGVSPAYGFSALALVKCSNEGGPGPRHNMKEDPGTSTLIMKREHGQEVPCDPGQVIMILGCTSPPLPPPPPPPQQPGQNPLPPPFRYTPLPPA
jgi:hypothetical protein